MIATLQNVTAVTDRDMIYRFFCPSIASSVRPGQFVEVEVSKDPVPYLRRPFSVFRKDGEYLELLVRTVGKGTEIMKNWETGTEVDILGPLGNGFSWNDQGKNFLLIGGGVGIAPLNYLAEELISQGKNVYVLFLPARTAALAEAMPCSKQLNIDYAENRTAFSDKFTALLNDNSFDGVFCCGPNGLMKAATEICEKLDIDIQVSLEVRMACGIGLCTLCAVPIRQGDEIVNLKVCKYGPVFEGGKVVFDE